MKNTITKKQMAAAVADAIKPAFSKLEFITTVEHLVKNEKLTYMEAILSVAASSSIEPEDIAHMVDGSIKDKLEVEAQKLNNLPRSSTATLC